MKPLLALTLVWLTLQVAGQVFDRGTPAVTAARVDVLLGDWPVGSQRLAREAISVYGLPDAVTRDVLWWRGVGRGGVLLYRDDALRVERMRAAKRLANDRWAARNGDLEAAGLQVRSR